MWTGRHGSRALRAITTTLGISLAISATSLGPVAAADSANDGPPNDDPSYQIIVREATNPGEAPVFDVVEASLDEITVLLRDPDVDSVELDGTSQLLWQPTDPDYPDQWEHHVTGIETAWTTTRGSSETVIAVIDSGVNPGPEFEGRLLPGASFIGQDPLVDALGHGTSVAAVAAAGHGNGIGGVGTCPECTILPVQVAEADGSVPWLAAANGIVWAADQGADIINLSFGGSVPSGALRAAIEYAIHRDVIVIAAAGNNGTDALVYPAATEGVISAAGHMQNFDRYSWSSYGDWVDVAAPGCARNVTASGTATVCGTSFASPWVAGAVALLIDAKGALTPAAVESLVEASTEPLAWVETGRVDASVLLNEGTAVLQLDRAVATAHTIDLSGQYRDDVVRVDLVVDDELVGSDTAPTDGTFAISWDARGVQPGPHQLQVDAIDGRGRTSRSQPVIIEIIADSGFTDVVSDAYYEDAVTWMVVDSITTGTSATTFSPDDDLTRGQFATFLWRFAGEPTSSSIASFGDTNPTAFYAAAVNWMVAQGITNGTGPTTFSPDSPVTRGQLAAFLYRFAGTTPGSRASFVDVDASSYYAEAVDWLVAESITTGTSPTTFSPDSPVTRGQLATFLWRLADRPII